MQVALLQPEQIQQIVATAVAEALNRTSDQQASAPIATPRVWFDRTQAADYLCCSVRTISSMVRNGRLPRYNGVGGPLYHITDLDNLPKKS